jgi:glycosyltransferase involved in cell wall biosynthesis
VSKCAPFEQTNFVADYILNLARTHQDHSFFFITDEGADIFLDSSNFTVVATTPKKRSMLLWKMWYAYKLPAILKKYNAHLFVNLDCIGSLKTTIPQCLLLPDISLLQNLSVFKKNVPASLEKALLIITFSEYVKNNICKEYYTIPSKKIKVIYTAANEKFLPVEWNEKEKIREKYAEGKEYFLFSGKVDMESNLVNLLKAFSFFKKRQKSNMQLIIVTKKDMIQNAFTKILKTYKYRNEVKIITGLKEEVTAIMAAAYAFVYAVPQTGFYSPVLQAMQSGVPVIVSNAVLMTEICGEAALFADPAIFESIADKMMLLFKDENKRNELITLGKQQATQFTMPSTNKLFWQNIVKCAGIPV